MVVEWIIIFIFWVVIKCIKFSIVWKCVVCVNKNMCIIGIWLFLWLNYIWVMYWIGYCSGVCNVLIWLFINVELRFIVLFVMIGGFVVWVFSRYI